MTMIAPLADRLRPQSLAEVVGQDHLVGPAGALTRMLGRGSLASLILWGPPGVGKTTIARLLAAEAGLVFVQLSAVFSGVADLTAPSRMVFCRWSRTAPLHSWAPPPKIRPSR